MRNLTLLVAQIALLTVPLSVAFPALRSWPVFLYLSVMAKRKKPSAKSSIKPAGGPVGRQGPTPSKASRRRVKRGGLRV